MVAGNVRRRGRGCCWSPGWARLLALGWELGEWYTFIRHGTELDTAYEDTLGDMTLGTLGGTVAAVLVAWRVGRGDRGLSATVRSD